MRLTSSAPLFLVLIFFAFPGRTAEIPPFNYAGVFKVYWNGITVGYAVAEIREQGTTYRLRARIETQGLARLISGYYSDSNTTGIILPDGSYRP
ncbi:MAG: DUF3108 domain-containing protein, partial [Alphaproteobacteria bacterium]|nr:DUF3108 domain-containing protein [Alphaproteobacteria bacterium]